MSFPEPKTDWEIGVANFINFLNVLGNPKSPLIWILSGVGVFYVAKNIACGQFGKFCDVYKGDIETMKCKTVRETLKSCRKTNENKDTVLARRGTKISKLENKLKDCVSDRIRILTE
jgi:hypothetical protein